MSRGQFEESGRVWPLVPGAGALACRPVPGPAGRTDQELTFLPSGQSLAYALNGTARRGRAYLDLAAVWADDPASPGGKKPLADLLAVAGDLCGPAAG